MLSSMTARGQVWGKVAKVALGERDSVVLELAALELVALELVVLELVAKAVLELVALGELGSFCSSPALFYASR